MKNFLPLLPMGSGQEKRENIQGLSAGHWDNYVQKGTGRGDPRRERNLAGKSGKALQQAVPFFMPEQEIQGRNADPAFSLKEGGPGQDRDAARGTQKGKHEKQEYVPQ